MRLVPVFLLAWLFLVGCSEPEEVREAALLGAAEQGDVPRIQSLLGANTDVNVRDICLFTPLMKAAASGSQESVALLLAAGAEVNAADKGGYSALLLAASNNHAAVVRRLLEAGAFVDQQEATQGYTALIWAASLGHAAVVDVLLEHGADPALRDLEGRDALQHARANGHEDIVARLSP
jgi:ankyrin repeat protein